MKTLIAFLALGNAFAHLAMMLVTCRDASGLAPSTAAFFAILFTVSVVLATAAAKEARDAQ